MAQPADYCPVCGRGAAFEARLEGEEIPVGLLENKPRAMAEAKAQRDVELLERITQQLDQLLELARGGAAAQQVADELMALRATLTPRHGLCTNRRCALCRMQEEAIKEHVLLYIDWKVPGTAEKLLETQRPQS